MTGDLLILRNAQPGRLSDVPLLAVIAALSFKATAVAIWLAVPALTEIRDPWVLLSKVKVLAPEIV